MKKVSGRIKLEPLAVPATSKRSRSFGSDLDAGTRRKKRFARAEARLGPRRSNQQRAASRSPVEGPGRARSSPRPNGFPRPAERRAPSARFLAELTERMHASAERGTVREKIAGGDCVG